MASFRKMSVLASHHVSVQNLSLFFIVPLLALAHKDDQGIAVIIWFVGAGAGAVSFDSARASGAGTLCPFRSRCNLSNWFMAWKSWRFIVV